jgi:hypothetical protein
MLKLNKFIGSAVVVGGITCMATTFYWGFFDYHAAYQADQLLNKKQLSEKEFVIAMYKADAHRMNVWFEGTWLIMGGILTAMGFLIAKD